jgi:hypothetical protein
MDCYLADRFGATLMELDRMTCEQVWRQWGYMHGRDIAMSARDDNGNR